ncbi:MAG: hypothetical protein RQ760_02820 [Sedimentisphaerales bacterium]|nr:hypothetical protein [Sedimentisphaerales bacterium]
MGRAFIHRLLNALFNRKKETNAINETKNRASTRDKAKIKTTQINTKSKANIIGEDKAETEIETEEKIRSCAVEVKTCIDLINKSTGTPSKPKGGCGHAKADNRKADSNRKTSSSNSDSVTKRNQQGVSPSEMVVLLAKVEEKVSEAVFKAKEKDDKKKKGSRKKRT